MTSEEYFQRVKDFKPVEITPKDRVLWVMWILYFEEIGMRATAYELKKGYGSSGMTWSVPTLNPADFDPETSVTMERAIQAQKRLGFTENRTEAERKEFVQATLKSFRASKLQQPETREAAE